MRQFVGIKLTVNVENCCALLTITIETLEFIMYECVCITNIYT